MPNLSVIFEESVCTWAKDAVMFTVTFIPFGVPTVNKKRKIKNIVTQDIDTIDIVAEFKERRGYATFSEALNKLVQLAKQAGLHHGESSDTREPSEALAATS